MVGNCLFSLTFDAVSFLPCLNHLLHILHDERFVLADLLNEMQIVCRNLLVFFFREYLLDFVHIIYQGGLIFRYYRDDMVHAKVTKDTCFDLNLLCIGFPLDFVSCLKLKLSHHLLALKHLDSVFIQITVVNERATCLTIQSTLSSLFFPFFRIAITIEMDRLDIFDVVAHHFQNSTFLCLTLFNQNINTLFEIGQSLCHSGIQSQHRTCTVSLRTHSTKFETITRKGKWRSAVTVCVVNQYFWDGRNVELHGSFPCHCENIIIARFLHMLQQIRNGASQKG